MANSFDSIYEIMIDSISSLSDAIVENCVANKAPIPENIEPVLLAAHCFFSVTLPLKDTEIAKKIFIRTSFSYEAIQYGNKIIDAFNESLDAPEGSILSNPIYAVSKKCIELLGIPQDMEMQLKISASITDVSEKVLPVLKEMEVSPPEKSRTTNHEDVQVSAPKKLFCKHCGASCENGAAYCPNCGKRVRFFSRQQNKSPITGIFLCISIVVNVLLLSALGLALITNSELEHANEGLIQNVQAITRERNLLEYENDGLTQTMNNYYDYYHFLQNNIALVIDPNGGVYHTFGCHFFQNCDTYWAYNVELAESKGYRPCEVCH